MASPLQTIAALPLRVLTWLGSQGTRGVAAIVFIAAAVPPLGALLRPYLTEAILCLLCISFMRVDLAALYSHLRRPALVSTATAWTTIGVPLIVGLIAHATGLTARAPGLSLALMLQSMASPMMASPALAALMGLDATLVLITLVTSTALVPFTASLFAGLFLGDMLSITPLTLGLKLLGILAASLLAATAIRWIFGAEAIQRHKTPIDGLNIIILFIFAAAIMGDVVSDLLAQPLFTISLAALSFAIYFTLLAITTLLFRRVGTERALALGLMVSQRNLGLMLAATAGVLPPTTWLYFALTQFPIHLAPYMLMPIARRLTARAEASRRVPAKGTP
ncbi:Na+-dependent transporter [Bradyrhizobium sp. WBOS7]|uniref:Na+-dependent transporter n=1 Tax=Bradyrhizobium betae TaxID=244734 RepID=A0AAE9NE07_9BRAD|nr:MULTISPECIES: Na+-dependent transporter [Bradyrhizobium]MDD1569977.1 Na+-dependent transporter [Bradyrhizobium sp. WBOS1]UUO36862.1 Na+-dependent transporter [Bradyrhizobium sp. WBOS01]MDD1525714.1 Na+-dependent transporter [Bradyrhizobium sp. WBOS2]MDD1576597.1 Na+-dependent transporter [Bradyrhizobium sp. WBOS7]MDD1598909.1 Na+-dependent transporter [Bradyrhizobium sp. WBOS16]